MNDIKVELIDVVKEFPIQRGETTRFRAVNNRNLDNLQVNIANTERLLKKHGKGKGLIISESGIAKPADVQYLKKAGADAFLVGTSIMETGNVGAKVAELYNAL